MKSSHQAPEPGAEFETPPFLYEIRVKGRLSNEQWTSWFDDLAISTAKGESTLRGRVPDHAALYALLARLRDLAIPLVAVKVLDAEAQSRLSQQSRRYDLMITLLLVGLYLTLFGGLMAITVFVAPIINPALVLALLFALLGGLAHAFWLWSGQAAWRWITYVTWPAAAIAFLIFLPVSGTLPTPLAIAIALFLGAGGLVYGLYFLRRFAADVRDRLAGGEAPPAWLPEEPAGREEAGDAEDAAAVPEPGAPAEG
jgi:hypothetical protein